MANVMFNRNLQRTYLICLNFKLYLKIIVAKAILKYGLCLHCTNVVQK